MFSCITMGLTVEDPAKIPRRSAKNPKWVEEHAGFFINAVAARAHVQRRRAGVYCTTKPLPGLGAQRRHAIRRGVAEMLMHGGGEKEYVLVLCLQR